MPEMSAHGLNSTIPYALPEELDYLKELSRGLRSDSNIVMIGAGPGVMALAVMEDHKPLDAPHLSIVEIDGLAFIETHLKAAGVSDSKCDFVLGDSGEIGKEWSGKVDLLIVDGDHTARGVMRDIDAWWDKVVVGGVVFFHDYLERPGGFNGVGAWVQHGVAEAIQSRQTSDWEVLAKPGISYVVRKRA
jgi:methyltransferase family protein